jgi:hypothetical protein
MSYMSQSADDNSLSMFISLSFLLVRPPLCQRHGPRPMNCFYRTSASNRSFRVEPARPRRHQLGKSNAGRAARPANQGKRKRAKAPANAHRLPPVRGPWPWPRGTRPANHAGRGAVRATISTGTGARAGARFTPGKLTGAAGAGFPRFPSVNANNSHPNLHS